MRNRMTKDGLSAVPLALCLLFGLSALSGAKAEDLDGAALKDLALRGTWQAEHAEYGFWRWQEDGTVCLRVGTNDGDCADTGTWRIDGETLCYELGWWGESVGERKNCVTVRPVDGESYETLFHGGAMVSRMFAFKVLE